jgi:predicted nucleotidyltransferase
VAENVIFAFKSLKMYLERYIGDIKILCQKNKVKSLYVFGSVLTNRFNEKSDIDLIVDIDSKDPLEYSDNYFNLKFALEELLNRPVDLLENRALKNPFLRESIDNSKTLLYAS